jgi:hypothetical protein
VDDKEIEYTFVKGRGWVAGYKKDDRILRTITVRFPGFIRRVTITGTVDV